MTKKIITGLLTLIVAIVLYKTVNVDMSCTYTDKEGIIHNCF